MIAISPTSKVDSADRSRTTGTWNTGIGLLHTSLALTDVAALTVRVPHTLRATPSDRVRLRDETWLTPTDGIAGPGQGTVGSGTTGGGVARLGDLYSVKYLENNPVH